MRHSNTVRCSARVLTAPQREAVSLEEGTQPWVAEPKKGEEGAVSRGSGAQGVARRVGEEDGV